MAPCCLYPLHRSVHRTEQIEDHPASANNRRAFVWHGKRGPLWNEPRPVLRPRHLLFKSKRLCTFGLPRFCNSLAWNDRPSNRPFNVDGARVPLYWPSPFHRRHDIYPLSFSLNLYSLAQVVLYRLIPKTYPMQQR